MYVNVAYTMWPNVTLSPPPNRGLEIEILITVPRRHRRYLSLHCREGQDDLSASMPDVYAR